MDRPRLPGCAAALVLACGPVSPTMAQGAGATQTVTTAGASDATTNPGASSSGGAAEATTLLDVAGSTGETTANTSGATTTGAPEPPPPCDIWDDPCPDGSKCVPYGEFGAPYPDWHGCFPVVEEPAQLGEPCVLLAIDEGSVVALDSCERGSVCSWRTGTCLALCQGEPLVPRSWVCPTLSNCTGWEDEPLCIPICDPLEPVCPEGERCNVFTSAGFQCLPESDDDLPVFASCIFAFECAAGTFCDVSSSAVECAQDSESCCNAFCDLDGGTCPGVGQACVPFEYYDIPLPEYADLGRCVVP